VLTTINPDVVKKLGDLPPGDIASNESFDAIKDQVVSLGNIFTPKGIDAVYLLTRKDNSIYFITESTPIGQPLYVLPGKLYEKPPEEAYKAFENDLTYSTPNYSDEFGTYISQFTPIVDKENNQVGVLGVDVDYTYYQKQVNQDELIFVLSWLLICSFLEVFWLYLIKTARLKKASIVGEQKIMAISNAVADGIVVINGESKIVFWNSASEKIFGYPFNKALGLKFNDLVKLNKPLDIKTGKFISNFKLSLASHFINSVLEIKIKNRKNSDYYELYTTVTDINNEPHLVAIFHNVSARKQEQLELEQQKNELEQLNDLMVGRELKMIELKKNIKDSKK